MVFYLILSAVLVNLGACRNLTITNKTDLFFEEYVNSNNRVDQMQIIQGYYSEHPNEAILRTVLTTIDKYGHSDLLDTLSLPSDNLEAVDLLLQLQHDDQLAEIPRYQDSLLVQLNQQIEGGDLNSLTGIYVTVQKLLTKAVILEEQNQIMECFATLHYGLYLLEKHSKGALLMQCKDELLSRLLFLISKETDGKVKYSKAWKYYYDQLSLHGNREELYLAEAYTMDGLEAITQFKKLRQIVRTDFHKFICNFNLAVNYEAICRDSALQYYRIANNHFPEHSCHKYRFYVAMFYKAFIQGDRLDLAVDRAFLELEQCPEFIADNVAILSFSVLRVMDSLTNVRKLDTLLAIRKISDRSFCGRSSLHLQDYYVQNTLSYSDVLFESGKEILKEYGKKLPALYEDTRNREAGRLLQYQDRLTEGADVFRYLEVVANFEEPKPFDSEVYLQLYQSFESLPLVDLTLSHGDVDFDKLVKKNSKENAVFIDLMVFSDYYRLYALFEEQIIIRNIDKETLEGEIEKTRAAIDEKLSVNPISLAELLDLPSMLTSDKIVLISDGVVSLLPFGACIEKIELYTDISSFLTSKVDSVHSSFTAVFGLSNDETIASKTRRKYPELQMSFEECTAVNNVMGGNVFVGAAFSRDVFFDYLNSDIIHLTTHLSASRSNRLNNYFLIRSDSDMDEIYTYELLLQTKKPKVAVLSTCESGVGEFDYGTGIFSLTKILQVLGTKTVIKTLWKVNEKATADFMIEMYRAWATGISLYDALDQTQEKFKNHPDYSHPYYWAGFVLEGNPNVYLKQDSTK